ncbi:MAG: DUF4474 domain-containing protein [Oscillospiraceae bacterium]|jgi:hypothetical protein|nr:DUF4474 domain-containing protein [Oscillospiraceae bacterium]
MQNTTVSSKKSYLIRFISVLLVFLTAAFLMLPGTVGAKAAGNQRTLSNPTGVLELPTPLSNIRYFHPGTANALITGVWEYLKQILLGWGDGAKLKKLMEEAPVVLLSERSLLPTMTPLPAEAASTLIILKGIRNAWVFLMETADPACYELNMLYTEADGDQKYMPLKLDYYPDTARIMSHDERGIWNVLLHPLVNTIFEMIIASDLDLDDFTFLAGNGRWIKVGFNETFDSFAWLLGMLLDDTKFLFDYAGKSWMIEFWRGNYTPLQVGCEVGIYDRPDTETGVHYNNSTTRLPMEATLYYGSQVLAHYEPNRVWWLGAFHLMPMWSLLQYSRHNMRVEGTITFEDQGMMDAFTAAVTEQAEADFTWSVDGMVFSYAWGKTEI